MDALLASIGVSTRLSSTTPSDLIRGALKSRHTDFLVHELPAGDGPRVELTRLWPHPVAGDAPVAAPPSPADAQAALAALVGADAAAALAALVAGTRQDHVDVPAFADKAGRQRLHEAVRALSPALESETLGEGAARLVRMRMRGGGGGMKRPRDDGGAGGGGGGGQWRRPSGPIGRPPFTRFVLHKVNWDTASAVRALAAALGVRDKAFGFAGTKDKRGCTSQHVTLYRTEPMRIAQAARNAGRGLAVGDFAFVPTGLHLGESSGNSFTITLRAVRCAGIPPLLQQQQTPADAAAVSEGGAAGATVDAGDAAAGAAAAAAAAAASSATIDAVTAVMTRWASHDHAFVNYFGLQRFGGTSSLGWEDDDCVAAATQGGGVAIDAAASSVRPQSSPSSPHDGPLRTHWIGRAILLCDWDEALRLILSPRPVGAEPPAAAAARALFTECHDVEGALRAMPQWMSMEKGVLSAILAHRRAATTSKSAGRVTTAATAAGTNPIEASAHAAGAVAAPTPAAAVATPPHTSIPTRGESLAGVLACPPKLRALYVHAYQSFLWNRLCTVRMEAARVGEGGTPAAALEGDLVLCGGVGEEGVEGGDEGLGGGEDEGGAPPPSAAAAAGGGGGGGGPPPLPRVHVVTRDEAAAQAFPLTDVVLPIPGASVTFPTAPGWGVPALAALLRADGFFSSHPLPSTATTSGGTGEGGGVDDGISDDEAHIRALFTPRDRRFHFTGAYRRVVGRAGRVQWRVIRYSSPSEDLAKNDLELILGPRRGDEGREGDGVGALIALQLTFTLPSSAYATVALREVLASNS